ncbi:MAG: CHAP domain-containing protein, partial [Jatrophihabitans sp.]
MKLGARLSKRGRGAMRLLVVAATVATACAGLVVQSSPAVAATRSDIATLALQNVGLGDCSRNSRGGIGFATSCSRHEYWCADFVIWVWQSLGIDVGGLDAGARSFRAYGQARGLLTNTPEVGDAVYFSDNGGVIQHVAVVTEVYPNGTIQSVSGDLGGQDGTMAQFADTSRSYHDAPYSGAIGAYSPAVGWNVAGYTRPQNVGGSVGGAIAVKYNQLGGAGGFLGAPTTDELTTPNSPWGVGKYNHFQNDGSI